MTRPGDVSGVPPLEVAVAQRLVVLRERLDAAGGAAVKIVGVTKGFGADVVAAAVAVGIDVVGESYAQEARAKREDLVAAGGIEPEWHFIGRLQRNKVRTLAPFISLWQSVDRLSLGEEIARRAPGARVLVQVDVSGEPQKGGCPPAELPALVDSLSARGLSVEGVMAVGPTGPPDAAAEPFAALVGLADRLGLAERSIGMSDDLEVAVAAGSTMVRIGRELFGPRPPRPPRASTDDHLGGDLRQ